MAQIALQARLDQQTSRALHMMIQHMQQRQIHIPLERCLDGPDAMQADREAARAALCAVLKDVAVLAGSEDAQTETW